MAERLPDVWRAHTTGIAKAAFHQQVVQHLCTLHHRTLGAVVRA